MYIYVYSSGAVSEIPTRSPDARKVNSAASQHKSLRARQFSTFFFLQRQHHVQNLPCFEAQVQSADIQRSYAAFNAIKASVYV
jgi:hypothetical protein